MSSDSETPPTGNQVFDRLRHAHPDKNPAFVAVDQLHTMDEIDQFLRGYTTWLSFCDDLRVQQNPYQIAVQNISYVLVDYNDHQLARLWTTVMEAYDHPYGIPCP